MLCGSEIGLLSLLWCKTIGIDQQGDADHQRHDTNGNADEVVVVICDAAFSVTTQSSQEQSRDGRKTAARLQLGWLAIGLMIAFVLFTLSRGLMGGRQRT